MAVEADVETWKEIICQWYPKILEETYFVPPVTINRVPMKVVEVDNKTVLKPNCSSHLPNTSSSLTDKPIRYAMKTPSLLQMQALQFIIKAKQKKVLRTQVTQTLDKGVSQENVLHSPVTQTLDKGVSQENVLHSPVTQTLDKGVSQENVLHSPLTQTLDKGVSQKAPLDGQLTPTIDKESEKTHSHGQSTDSLNELKETSLHKQLLQAIESTSCKKENQDQPKILDTEKSDLKNSLHSSQDHLKTPVLTASGMWIGVTSQPLCVQESHLREDLSLQKVLCGLQVLAREQKEVMFVVSQLQFCNYLNKIRCTTTANFFPRTKQQGDFDLLLIHRYYGILVGEIKSIRSDQTNFAKSQAEIDKDIIDKIKTAMRQLDKAEAVVREVTADKGSQLFVHKTCIFPYISRKDFKRILDENSHLKQDLSQCMKTEDLEQAIDFCLLSDNLPDDSSSWNVKQLQTWWNKRVSLHPDPSMTSDVYLDLVARFCGPATTVSIYCVTPPRVEVRTRAEGVAVVGERMALLVLTHEQIDLLTRSPPRVILTGGPGVGKSVVLALKAIDWVQKGYQVQVISTRAGSVAASFMLHHVIQESVRTNPTRSSTSGTVRLHLLEIRDNPAEKQRAISILEDTKMKGPYVILDEFWGLFESGVDQYQKFISTLLVHFPNINLWAASPVYNGIPPGLQEEPMTTLLRSPPTVQKEVEKSFGLFGVYPYTSALSCSGLDTIRLRHQGLGHMGGWPVDCEECGKMIAEVLKGLKIGTKGLHNQINKVITAAMITSNANTTKTKSPPPLQYRDVFVLTRCTDIRDDVRDDAGNVTSTANGVVRGLRDGGVPVFVLRSLGEMQSVALSKKDAVTFVHDGLVFGLERKVVVWLPYRLQGTDDLFTDVQLDLSGRLHAMSRSTAQLVVVEVPDQINR